MNVNDVQMAFLFGIMFGVGATIMIVGALRR